MKITALVMTYNHEQFISQALDSALCQEATSGYEILISEDCSSDRTQEIVLKYAAMYPDRIRLLLSECNLHSNEVVARGIRAARGAYIALLDGDDYWTSPYKLQRQADFLDHHSECAVCFHNAEVLDERAHGSSRRWTPAGQREISTIEDIWQGNFIATSATMFRKGLIGDIPDWYISLFPITDWPLHILNAEHGKIGFIDEVMSVYRYHPGGLYSQLSEARKLEATSQFYKLMNANLGYRYNRVVKSARARYFFDWAQEYMKRGDYHLAWSCLLQCLAAGSIGGNIRVGAILKLALRMCVPDVVLRPVQIGRSFLSGQR